ncbi:MAG: DUF2066 domain-containing protein [Stellaceae bacterium]
MAVRLVPAIAEERARWSLAFALLLSLVAMLPASSAQAEAANEAYSATVKVDAIADNAAAAREAARIDGQRRALAAVIEHLSASADAKPPKLDDKTITDMVDSFEVANERMSAVRYIADYTFHFKPSKVRRLVRVVEPTAAETAAKGPADGGAKAAGESGGKPIVVLPVYKDGADLSLWDDPNAWRSAWAQRSGGSEPSRLLLPLGDANDLAAIDAEKAEAGEPQALSTIAQRNGGAETVVALATSRRPDGQLAGLDVKIKRYRSGRLVDVQGSSFDAQTGESEAEFLQRAADAVALAVESGARGQRSDRQASLAATIPLTSLGEWVQVRSRLAGIDAIRRVNLLSLSRQEARIEVKYVGSPDQLKSSLAAVDLNLDGGDPVWRIQPAGAASPR